MANARCIDITELSQGDNPPYKRSSYRVRIRGAALQARLRRAIARAEVTRELGNATIRTNARGQVISTTTPDRKLAGQSLLPRVVATPEGSNEDALISYLEAAGFLTLAGRIREHVHVLGRDPEEPAIEIESLRSLVMFANMYPQLKHPLVISNSEGLLGLEWHIQDGASGWDHGTGVVSLIFSPADTARIAALCLPRDEDQNPPHVCAESTREYTLRYLGDFASMIANA